MTANVPATRRRAAGGLRRGGNAGEDLEGRSAEIVTLVVLGVLRAGTLMLGLAQGGRTAWLVAVLAAQSALTFARAWWRLRRRLSPPLDAPAAVLETCSGALALLLVSAALGPGALTTSAYWAEPYTVITAVVLGAAGWRFRAGALGTAALTGTYLAVVLVAGGPHQYVGAAAATSADAAVWNNAVSYLPFFCIAHLGFGLVRSIMGQSEMLRAMLGRIAGEQARVAAASRAYRIGHDIPKALLREVRRGTMTADQLAPWAQQYRHDLAGALGDDRKAPADLGQELRSLCLAFVPVARLDLDLRALDGPLPAGLPVLTLVGAVRELLNNAAYHAYGYPVSLSAANDGRQVTIGVASGGPGADPERVIAAWQRKRNSVHLLSAAGGSYAVSLAGPPTDDVAGGLSVLLRWPAGPTAPTTGTARAATGTALPTAQAIALDRPPLGAHRPGGPAAAQGADPPLGPRASGTDDGGVPRRRPGALRKAAAGATAAVVSLGLAILGLAWYSTVRLTDVQHVGPTYPLRVVSVGRDKRAITLSRGPDAAEPGTFRLAWPGGQATVAGVLTASRRTVTRELADVRGALSAGQAAGIQPGPYTGNPWQALRVPFTEVGVHTALGRMPAWYVAGKRRTWVVIVHGLGGQRPDDLTAISLLHPLGFPLLAITYRNDVGAPASPDHLSHLGGTEWRDVGSAISYAMSHGARAVVLYGYSLGGALCLVAAHDPAYSPYVRGIVLDSPLLGWRQALSYQAARLHLPGFITTVVEDMVHWRTGLDFSQFSEASLEHDLSVPALLFQGSADTVVPPRLAGSFARADRQFVTYVPVTGADHVSSFGTAPVRYRSALDHFVARYP